MTKTAALIMLAFSLVLMAPRSGPRSTPRAPSQDVEPCASVSCAVPLATPDPFAAPNQMAFRGTEMTGVTFGGL